MKRIFLSLLAIATVSVFSVQRRCDSKKNRESKNISQRHNKEAALPVLLNSNWQGSLFIITQK